MTEGNQPSPEQVDLLVAITLASEQAGELSNQLVQNKFRFTLVNTSSDVFQSGTTFMLVGIASHQHGDLLALIESVCHTRVRFVPASGNIILPEGLPPVMIQAQVGSAYVYTLEVEHYEYF